MAVDLVTSRHLRRDEQARCYGVYALDIERRRVETLPARAVVLASGGVGKVYRYTSNPDTATGDGIAMAWRAGCRVGNMEFIQFHPTCLYHPQERSFLITEALRGEGAVLRLPSTGPGDAGGHRFMPAHDARAELAPRDIVARAIDFEMKKHGLDHVWLDATPIVADKGEAFLKEHFPTIHARCLALGIDIARQPIPVVPAAHYTCGGVVTDLAGRTDLPGLYAVGETTYTGLHGANRLASNSLLECVVLGHSCAGALLADAAPAAAAVPPWDESQVEDADEQVVIAHNWDELRLLMWNYVGIVRTTKRLERALHRIKLLRDEIDEYYANFRVTRDLLELRNLVACAELIVRSALRRHESRGLHYSRDFPDALPVSFPTVLTRPARSGRR
jgi:L-aspartate oxidase